MFLLLQIKNDREVKISINPTNVKLQIIAKNTIFKTINIVKFGISNISKNP
jgi:hypothetical protein